MNLRAASKGIRRGLESGRAVLPCRPLQGADCCPRSGFTLLEVMIAMSIFFISIFAILELTNRSLNMARALQYTHADPAILAAEITLEPELEEGSESGDFGDMYPNATWERLITPVEIDGEPIGLFQVDFLVTELVGRKRVQSGLSILLYRPASGTGTGIGSGSLGGSPTR